MADIFDNQCYEMSEQMRAEVAADSESFVQFRSNQQRQEGMQTL